MEDDELFKKNENGRIIVDTEILREHFFEEGRLSESQVIRLLNMGKDLLRLEDNLVQVDAPITSTTFVLCHS